MKYMVMECHPGYAVVLDEAGAFLKVANRSYQVGQTLTEVEPMRMPSQKKNYRWISALAAAAACLALVLGITLPGRAQPYASVYVKINPEVRIDVDQKDRVVGLQGVNQDGTDLIDGYAYQHKDLDLVTDELVDRAIDLGYLQTDGQITISLDSQDQTWVDSHSHTLSDHLSEHLQERIVVTIQVQICHGGDQEHEHHWETPTEETYTAPTNPNRAEIQPTWDDDDDDHDDWDDDDHDDWDDDHDDAHDDWDDDRDEDRDDGPEDDRDEDRDDGPEDDRDEDRNDGPEEDRDDDPEDDRDEDRDDDPEDDWDDDRDDEDDDD